MAKSLKDYTDENVTPLPYDLNMAFDLPSSLSPSKVSSFKDCALKFRLANIDKLPEEPSLPAVRGTLVHSVLELLFQRPPQDRSREAAGSDLAEALTALADDPEYLALGLTDDEALQLVGDSSEMLDRYFTLENPTKIMATGLELTLEVEVGSLLLRGIIDRLEETPDGGLIVTDYKTGRSPSVRYEQSRLTGVHFYSLLCERVYGKRPKEVRLVFLGPKPEIIIARPTEQSSKALERKVLAIWNAVERACEREDFRPRQGPLCNWCSFKEFCPEFGGDPSLAV